MSYYEYIVSSVAAKMKNIQNVNEFQAMMRREMTGPFVVLTMKRSHDKRGDTQKQDRQK